MFDTGLEPMTSVVGGRRLDDWATKVQQQTREFFFSYFAYFMMKENHETPWKSWNHDSYTVETQYDNSC